MRIALRYIVESGSPIVCRNSHSTSSKTIAKCSSNYRAPFLQTTCLCILLELAPTNPYHLRRDLFHAIDHTGSRSPTPHPSACDIPAVWGRKKIGCRTSPSEENATTMLQGCRCSGERGLVDVIPPMGGVNNPHKYFTIE
ncbi:hypothetical protein CEXT_97451 [Caerostris extrusa]|uniref:Uncharacterized protein n=1 Tax=Caerostris extrusa TaxID=172846 RepID=A0AAV4Y1J1_CAEEX|nr:hypothetical protein CEXT_97451 [Caerostris extrusa]